jgi:hypothetical protein
MLYVLSIPPFRRNHHFEAYARSAGDENPFHLPFMEFVISRLRI